MRTTDNARTTDSARILSAGPSAPPTRLVRPLAASLAPILAAALALAAITGAATGCTTVRPYQKAWLNDYNMQLGKTDIEKFDESAHSYREGASGGGNGKASGGCSCN